mmetsp:Transcript_9270/g.32666  ORF Transcript_9270/g.32666 Transcript_9270/m.32666 type:complete len:221 (-) Transcript_9270:916-1578(-)
MVDCTARSTAFTFWMVRLSTACRWSGLNPRFTNMTVMVRSSLAHCCECEFRCGRMAAGTYERSISDTRSAMAGRRLRVSERRRNSLTTRLATPRPDGSSFASTSSPTSASISRDTTVPPGSHSCSHWNACRTASPVHRNSSRPKTPPTCSTLTVPTPSPSLMRNCTPSSRLTSFSFDWISIAHCTARRHVSLSADVDVASPARTSASAMPPASVALKSTV